MKTGNGGIEYQKDCLKRTFLGIAKTHGKFYTWGSCETLRILLARYHHLNVSLRTLSRRLKELEAEGYIVRQMRTMPDGNGGKRFTSSLTYLTKKLLFWAKKLGDYARKVFSFFREPIMAHYSSKPIRRDLERASGIVEILWKSPIKGRASPI